MKATVAKLCSVLALVAGVTLLGGIECGFDEDKDFGKAAVVEQQ